MLFELPIILSGNSFFIYLLFPNISWSNSWNCKSQMDKTIHQDRDTLIELSQLICLTAFTSLTAG